MRPYLNTPRHVRACGCEFPVEKRGRSALVPRLFPPSTGMRSHHQADSIETPWPHNLNPFPLQSIQRLIKAHTQPFLVILKDLFVTNVLEALGLGGGEKNVQPCTLNIKYLNMFAFVLLPFIYHLFSNNVNCILGLVKPCLCFYRTVWTQMRPVDAS